MNSRPGAGSWLERLTRLSAPALMLLIVSATAFTLLARFTELWEPHPNSVPRAELAGFHTGSPPCLRYAEAPDAGSLDDAAEALAAAGFSDAEFHELRGDVDVRIGLLEAPHHSRLMVDEYLELMSRRGGLVIRVAQAIKGERYRDTLSFWVGGGSLLRRNLASLPAGRRAVLESQLARDPTLFAYPGISTLLELLAVKVTSRRLDRVQLELERRAEAGEALDLESLGISRTERSDDWYGTFELERSDAGLILMSLGHDGKRGGTGLDSDLVRVIREPK